MSADNMVRKGRRGPFPAMRWNDTTGQILELNAAND
jgi:hypothetical protein